MNEMLRMQLLAYDWGERCFGKQHMRDKRVRALRHAEEAIELAQACGVEPELLHHTIDVVYARPAGSPRQELGGSLLTAGVLAIGVCGEPIDQLFFDELQRCLRHDPEHFAKRNDEKMALGLK
jgi:hypothetical protein